MTRETGAARIPGRSTPHGPGDAGDVHYASASCTAHLMRICVYCASSQECDPHFHEVAFRLGALLAEADCTVVYGGGSAGSMGAVADGALSVGGKVIGILPKFMADLEWGHPGLTQLELVEDMRERKHRLLTDSDAVIALPGGCGTLEELFEAITLKRLGLYFNPIILLNTRDFYAPLQAFMKSVIDQRFMNSEHLAMWSLVDAVEDVLPMIRATPRWREDARDIAVVRR
ncbi:MAG TPA: TIGR00730 family Rossman fold protein [Dokdonella sp.]|nr:TIGR00730 family Rossman fold protein [Dokdonella sp.]